MAYASTVVNDDIVNKDSEGISRSRNDDTRISQSAFTVVNDDKVSKNSDSEGTSKSRNDDTRISQNVFTVVNHDKVSKNSDSEGTSKSRNDDSRISQNVLLDLPAEDRLKTYFQNALSYTLQKYLDSVKFSVFKRGYPELYEKSRGNLREFYKQFKSQLKSSVQIDLDNLCQQTNTGTLLCELDKLIKERKTNINGHSWRPSGNPEEDIKDHVYQEKQNYEEQLKSYLQILKTEKEELETELSKNHEAILQLQKEHHELHDALGVTLKSVNDVGIQIEDVIHDILETEN